MLKISIDDFDVESFLHIARNFGSDRFGYVVTPNTDHIIRLHDHPDFREIYRNAAFVLMDSRFLSLLLWPFLRARVRCCPGSDMTERLFGEVVQADDRVVLVGATVEQAAQLRTRYGLTDLRQHIPPMGFIRDPLAVEQSLEFIERNSPFRFCFIAVGTPQGEALARALQLRGRAQGLVACIGASINFLTGVERRAPRWMQRLGLEWLYRLARSPRRLTGRYLWRGPRVFALLPSIRFVIRKPQVVLPVER